MIIFLTNHLNLVSIICLKVFQIMQHFLFYSPQITLKLFSFGFLLIIILKVSYTSSAPFCMVLVISCWYWFGSKNTLNVLDSPLRLGLGSGPEHFEKFVKSNIY